MGQAERKILYYANGLRGFVEGCVVRLVALFVGRCRTRLRAIIPSIDGGIAFRRCLTVDVHCGASWSSREY
jgi:hypothetical protein